LGPLVGLGERDPVASVDTSQAEDPERADLRGLCVWWLGELKLDEFYSSARLVEIGNECPAGYNSNPLRDILLRIAGDKNGDISTKRLGEWLSRNCGQVMRIGRHHYWLVKERDPHLHAAVFRLSEVK